MANPSQSIPLSKPLVEKLGYWYKLNAEWKHLSFELFKQLFKQLFKHDIHPEMKISTEYVPYSKMCVFSAPFIPLLINLCYQIQCCNYALYSTVHADEL